MAPKTKAPTPKDWRKCLIPMPPYTRSLLEDLHRRNQAGPNVVRLDGAPQDWKPSPFVLPSPTAKSGYVEEPRYSHEKALAAAGVPHVSFMACAARSAA